MLRRHLFFLFSLLLLPLSLTGAISTFPLGHVNDYANLLSRYEQHQLESKLREFKNAEGHEIAVVTLRSLDGQSIESKAQYFFDTWKIGKKSHNNGLLLLIAMQEREIRIQTGYGLESLLPDAAAGRIIRNSIGPHLKNQEYYKGISEGVSEVILHLKSEPFPKAQQHKKTEDDSLRWIVISGLILIPLLSLSTPRSWGLAPLVGIFLGVLAENHHIFIFLIGYSFLIPYLLSSSESTDDGSSSGGGYYGGNHYGGFGGSGGGFGGFGGGSSGGGGASGRF